MISPEHIGQRLDAYLVNSGLIFFWFCQYELVNILS